MCMTNLDAMMDTASGLQIFLPPKTGRAFVGQRGGGSRINGCRELFRQGNESYLSVQPKRGNATQTDAPMFQSTVDRAYCGCGNVGFKLQAARVFSSHLPPNSNRRPHPSCVLLFSLVSRPVDGSGT